MLCVQIINEKYEKWLKKKNKKTRNKKKKLTTKRKEI